MYAPLKDDEDTTAAHDAALEGISNRLQSLRYWMWVLSLLAGSLVIALLTWTGYDIIPQEYHRQVRQQAELASIPIVALFFTWFHIWLAIQMMFLPLKFFGLWQHGDTGIGIGWQGVVPRKAVKMAQTAFRCARPYLLGPRHWLDRVDPKILVARVRPHLAALVGGALKTVGRRHFPDLWDRQLPAAVHEELVEASLDNIQETCPEIWREFMDLLCDEDIGIDNDGMIVSVFQDNKALLNHFFLSMGAREFRFIERCGAALGFVCGCVQLVAWREMQGTARIVLLPLTGFFLGIVTNWLAIQMCFRPVMPVPLRICGWHICDLQGLFLKRQPEVCELYSKMLVDHFFNFSKVVEYLQTRHILWGRLTTAYHEHNSRVLRHTLGPVASTFAPLALGRGLYERLEHDIQMELVERIATAHQMHKDIERFIAVSADIFRTNRDAMTSMPPDKFENLLHPVFQEDEWILILLGGVLGAVVGVAQVHFLSE